MKLITAIINKKDSGEVCRALTEAGFYFTKMASAGGFLTTGNVTLMIGTEKVDEVLDLIRTHCARHIEALSPAMQIPGAAAPFPTEVTVGGATIFVTDIERFEKI